MPKPAPAAAIARRSLNERDERLCELLECLLRRGGAIEPELEKRLRAAGLDLDHVRKCLEGHCAHGGKRRRAAGRLSHDRSPDDGIFDAAVVGAGPAGSATARWLALRGWRVALLERTRFEAPRIGESLAPNVQEPLRELGLWPEFLALAPLPSWGSRSLWGDAAQQSHSHLLNPYGCGWHVDRRAFDHMLAHAAVAAGRQPLRRRERCSTACTARAAGGCRRHRHRPPSAARPCAHAC